MVARRMPLVGAMPRVRGECLRGPRPCPHGACRYHLDDGQCVLDLAERDGMSLQEVGDVLRLSREWIRRIESGALRKLREAMKNADGCSPVNKASSAL